MLERITDAPLKVPTDCGFDFSFSPFVLSVHHCTAEEAHHLSEQRKTRDPPAGIAFCLAVEQAFLNMSCLLFAHWGLLHIVPVARSVALVFL